MGRPVWRDILAVALVLGALGTVLCAGGGWVGGSPSASWTASRSAGSRRRPREPPAGVLPVGRFFKPSVREARTDWKSVLRDRARRARRSLAAKPVISPR